MQSSFGVINLAIVNGQPRVLNLKQMLEAGEIARTEGQPRGGEASRRRQPARAQRSGSERRDRVSEASEDSFPASDAPSWTGTRRDVAS